MAAVRTVLRIRGRVQGVFYRASTAEQARALGLTGWVRNVPDGSVEVVAEGPEEAVGALETWCHRGPPGASVRAVEARREPASGEFDAFSVRFLPW